MLVDSGGGEGVHRVPPDPRPAVRLTTRGRDPGDELAEREEREDSENRVAGVAAERAPVLVAEERAALPTTPAREGVG